MSKGSKRRPSKVAEADFSVNWNRIFKNKAEQDATVKQSFEEEICFCGIVDCPDAYSHWTQGV